VEVPKSRKISGSGRNGPDKASPSRPKAVRGPARPVQAVAKAVGAPVKAVQAAAVEARPVRHSKTYLSKKELDEFRTILLQKRRQLLGDLSGMAEQSTRDNDSGNLSTMPTHMADVGTDNFEHEFTLGLLENEQALLREIEEAIRRIEDRTYGICLGTGQPIPKTRLLAKPWAKYTVDYARKLENGLVRPPDAGEHPRDEAAGTEEEHDEEEVESAEVPEEYEPEADAELDRGPEQEG